MTVLPSGPAGWVSAIESPSPSPTPTPPDPAIVTPGVPGFLVFALLALIVVLLVLSMSRHLRRIDARAAAMERDAEQQAGEAPPQDLSPDGPPTTATEEPGLETPSTTDDGGSERAEPRPRDDSGT